MKISENTLANHLLASLPPQELSKIIPILKPCPLTRKTTVYGIGDTINAIYFPCGGLISEMAILADGGGLEIMSIGREGAFGITALFGPATSAHEVTVQMSGAGWCVPVNALKRILEECPVLTDSLSHYFNSWFLQVAQIAACTGRHTVPQRCANKLLSASERSGSTHLPLTHENLANALGVRRAGITNAMSAFERDRSIQCMRGSIEILNIVQLRSASCECSKCENRSPRRYTVLNGDLRRRHENNVSLSKH